MNVFTQDVRSSQPGESAAEAPVSAEVLTRAVDAAARQIPPMWPLEATVAVNPFLGQTGEPLAQASARLRRIGGFGLTRPRAWYLDAIADGAISDDDLRGALDVAPVRHGIADVAALKLAAGSGPDAPAALPTVAELAARADGTDWPAVMTDRIGAWAAGYFDAGQALWAAPRGLRAWAAYRAQAIHDLTPEIQGLSGFARFVAALPDDPLQAVARFAARLGLTAPALESYFHQLLFGLGGWAQLARQRLWQAELANGSDQTVGDLLAIRLAWEVALFERFEDRIGDDWQRVAWSHAEPVAAAAADAVDAILQNAAERAAQRRLAGALAAPAEAAAGDDRSVLHGVFCIDVRSEVFRRALESQDAAVRTSGFAGFFGLATAHRGFASDVEERRLPVLLTPARTTRAGGEADLDADRRARFGARARRAWGRFKLAAVSSFAFVEAMGPVYAGKLLRDGLSLASAGRRAEPAPVFDPAVGLDDRVDMAETVLRAMSLIDGFARVVLLTGHGAGVVNNPHASSLHCGACGGHSGEVNARLLAALLNEPDVRRGLAARGIDVPADTLFLAALHDTTADTVTLFDGDADTSAHATDLSRIRDWLAAAGTAARAERAPRLPRASRARDLERRGRDWAQVRPEWGLAGCSAFIAAPRSRTRGRDLAGRAFLHDYDWQADAARGFPVLELIMTAPVVVASWISLQYYGSSVAPGAFGAGNKLLHNVVGGIGVLEGNGGVLRAGLPWQSVHDGRALVHEPLRLTVCVAAPKDAMNDVLARHPSVRALFDNGWLHLLAMDDAGRIAAHYAGDLEWTPFEDVEETGQTCHAA